MKKLSLTIIISALLLCGCSGAVEVVSFPAPTSLPAAAATPAPDELVGALRISEMMIKNRATLRDRDGDFSDWIELENCSGEVLRLAGWSIGDGEDSSWALPDISLEPGELLLLYASGKDRTDNELHTDFKLSQSEPVIVFTPMGNVSHSLSCEEDLEDLSLALIDGEFSPCSYPSPGYENSSAGYDAWQSSLECAGPLVINEVMAANLFDGGGPPYNGSDWVELRNISDRTIELSDYYLSDDGDDYRLWQLPKKQLASGDTLLILCSEEGSEYLPCAPFELSSSDETLYLSSKDGLIDYAFLRDIPINGSYGRMEGENGFFFFPSTSINFPNYNGSRRISQSPVSLTEDGVFNGVDSVTVELEGSGSIYYTLDGSLPSTASPVYTEPITVDSSCVVRAVAVQDGALPSKALTLSFILNENHSLPVISLVADSPYQINDAIMRSNKAVELPGNISLFEEGESFTIDCGISLTGHQSLILPKKSMKVEFRGVYGDETLDYDVFDLGVSSYSSLALRAGQDNHRVIFRQEIWQDLCYEMTDLVPSQHSKFCVLYLNGEYYGIYCLKEDISRQYFADLEGVSKDSVDDIKVPDEMTEEFVETVLDYCHDNDMSQKEHYEYICSVVDMDSFIDWMILQGSSGNIDLFRNVRFFRSSETDGKWKSVLFDLDHAMLNDYSTAFILGHTLTEENWLYMSVMGRSDFSSIQLKDMVSKLLENEDFRNHLLRRFTKVYDTVLSNENILERIDYYQALLEPEVARDWKKWDADISSWYRYIDMLRRSVTEQDWERLSRDALCHYLDLSDEEIRHYFG